MGHLNLLEHFLYSTTPGMIHTKQYFGERVYEATEREMHKAILYNINTNLKRFNTWHR